MIRLAAMTLTTALLVATMSGCGFHLRGSPDLYEQGGHASTRPLQTPIVVRYPKGERAWATLIRAQFERAGMQVINNETDDRQKALSADPEDHRITDAAHMSEGNSTALYPTLTLLKSEQSRRIASFTNRAKVAEYTLSERLTYQLMDARGASVVPEHTFSSERVYEFNVNNINGKDQEAALITTELRQAITMKLIRHIFNIADKLYLDVPN